MVVFVDWYCGCFFVCRRFVGIELNCFVFWVLCWFGEVVGFCVFFVVDDVKGGEYLGL